MAKRARRELASDLTAAARIRNTAIRLFAARGFGATSIRSVAAAARVSAGLVQHHYRTKAELRRAVNEFVVRRIAEAVPPVSGAGSPPQVAAEIGRLITELFRGSPELFAYIRRSLLEGDATGLALFDGVVHLVHGRLQELDADGALRPGLDLQWAALHIVLLDAGALMLETAVNRQLDAPLLSDAGLERWSAATTALLTDGIFRAAPAARPTTRQREGETRDDNARRDRQRRGRGRRRHRRP